MTAGQFWMGLATIIAVVLGPILAVVITRINDDRRADRARKLDIFRTLMRTRRMPVHFEHVGALNLVEVEFVDYPDVVKAWKEYLSNLGEDLPPIEQKDRFDAAVKKRDSLLTRLIHEISKVLKINVEQLDILEGNYVPQGWHDEEWEQRLARRGLIGVLQGMSPIIVQFQQPGQAQNPYPPPPAPSGSRP
jgi:hypothetical protein